MNYSYQPEPEPSGFDISELNLPSQHHFNIGAGYNGPKLAGQRRRSATQSSAYWQDVLDSRFHGPTDGFTIASGTIGYKWRGDRLVTSLKVSNLFDEEILQHVFGDVTRRQIVAELKIGVLATAGRQLRHRQTRHRPGVERPMSKLSWLLQVVVAVILLQTLFFKFTGAEESVYIFTTVGAEPWGRYGSGVIELIAAILLLVPGYAVYGAVLALGVGVGAVVSHLTVLGIDVKGDGGLLFGLAWVVLAGSAIVLTIHRRKLPIVGASLLSPRRLDSLGG